MKIDVNTSCCICQGTESDVLFEMTYKEHGYPGIFTLRKCRGCQLLFNSPRLDSDDLKALYGRNYYFFKRKASEEFKRIARMYARTISLVDREVKHKKALEIGSAKGYFLAILKSLGWEAEGVEISDEAVDYAQTTFGVECFQGNIESFAKEHGEQKYPLVLAIDVIEHVPDPIAFCQSAAKIVEEGGYFIIDTPNGGALNIENEKDHWQGFNPFHIYLFQVKNLTSLLEGCGLTIELAFSYGNSVKKASSKRRFKRKIKDSGLLILRKLGILNTIKSVLSVDGKNDNMDALIADTQKEILKQGAYLQDPDAVAELAKDIQGDNLLILARKKS